MLREVGFDQAFTYAYSRREQTYAGLFHQDDVPEPVKARRLAEVIDTFQAVAAERNRRIETGRLHVVLVEGLAKKSREDRVLWTGRTDTNKRVVFSDCKVLGSLTGEVASSLRHADASAIPAYLDTASESIHPGAYVVVKVLSVKGHTLRGSALAKTTIKEAHELNLYSL